MTLTKGLYKKLKTRRLVEPEMTYAYLTYRGVTYCKWVCTNSLAMKYQKETNQSPNEMWFLDW